MKATKKKLTTAGLHVWEVSIEKDSGLGYRNHHALLIATRGRSIPLVIAKARRYMRDINNRLEFVNAKIDSIEHQGVINA